MNNIGKLNDEIYRSNRTWQELIREERTLWKRVEEEEKANRQLEGILDGKILDANSQIKNLEAVEEEEKKDTNLMLRQLEEKKKF